MAAADADHTKVPRQLNGYRQRNARRHVSQMSRRHQVDQQRHVSLAAAVRCASWHDDRGNKRIFGGSEYKGIISPPIGGDLVRGTEERVKEPPLLTAVDGSTLGGALSALGT